MPVEFAGLQLEPDAFYEIRQPEEPDWFVIARFDHVERLAVFGDRPAGPLVSVSATNIENGTNTVSHVPDLADALEPGEEYRVFQRTDERVATFQGPGPQIERTWPNSPDAKTLISPTLRFGGADAGAYTIPINHLIGVTSLGT